MPPYQTYFLHVVEALDHSTGSKEVLETAHWGKDWAGESVVLMMMMVMVIMMMVVIMILARTRTRLGTTGQSHFAKSEIRLQLCSSSGCCYITPSEATNPKDKKKNALGMAGQGRAVQATVGHGRERTDRAGRVGEGRVGPCRQAQMSM